MISYKNLIPGKEYYIQIYNTCIYFKGMIFHHYQQSFEDSKTTILHIIFTRKTEYHLFYKEDYYYDTEQIKRNSEHAKHQMEDRALNMILKKLVNEEFQWL